MFGLEHVLPSHSGALVCLGLGFWVLGLGFRVLGLRFGVSEERKPRTIRVWGLEFRKGF